MTRRGIADLSAALVALTVLVAGLVSVVGDSNVLAPESKTTVTKQAVAGTAGTTRTTETTINTTTVPSGMTKGTRGRTTTTTVETTGGGPDKPAETTTTVESGERTFSERVLGDGGIVVLQIAAVMLAAFIAGAAVQRVILGQFSFKLGGFELDSVVEGSAAALDTLNAKVDAMSAETTAALKNLDEARRDDAADLKEDLALAYKRMALLEDKIDG